jgi:hypothetical protein
MNSSLNGSVQLNGLQRLSQLLINAGGMNHFTNDSLIVIDYLISNKDYFFLCIKHCLSSLGFIDPHIREIVHSINVLINYGLITIENPLRRNEMSSSSSHLMYSSQVISFFFLFYLIFFCFNLKRDYQENYSRNSIDMDYKRFKSDQQRTNKNKR